MENNFKKLLKFYLNQAEHLVMKPSFLLKSNPPKRKLLNILGHSGQATLQVLIAAAVIAIGTYYTSTFVINYKTQTMRMENYLNLRTALQSSVDFVIFGIKRKNCFDSVMMQDATCDLDHSASVERLIMSLEQESYLKAMFAADAKAVAQGKASKYPTLTAATRANPKIEKIEKSISFASLSSAHPLYLITKDAKLRSLAQGIHVVIERNKSMYLPRYGGEAYLKLTVELIGSNGDVPMVITNHSLRITSTLSIHPREVGSFALLVPQDLHLDKPHMALLNTGDTAIHNVADNSQLIQAAKNSRGLLFLSPVFVNRDIYMPAANTYTPVTFADKVYMGNGLLKLDQNPYRPATTGLPFDRLWSTHSEFGGFLRGVENDGALDKGLTVFGKIVTPANLPEISWLDKCVRRSQSLTNNDILLQSSLSSKIETSVSSGNSATFRLQLSDGNIFSRQYKSNSDPLLEDPGKIDAAKNTAWIGGGGTFRRVSIGNNESAAMMTVNFSFSDGNTTYELSADLARQEQGVDASTKEFIEFGLPTTGLQTFKANFVSSQTNNTNIINASNANIAASRAQITTSNNLITTNNRIITTKTADIVNFRALTPPNNTEISAAETAIANARSIIATETAKINTENTKILAEQAKIDAANLSNNTLQKEIASVTNLLANPPKVKLYLEPVIKRKNKVSTNKADLFYSVTHADSMRNSEGKPYSFDLGIKSYDLTFQSKVSISQKSNGSGGFVASPNVNLNGTLSFSRSGSNINIPSSFSTLVPEDPTDYETLDEDCKRLRDTLGSQSFGVAEAGSDFSDSTRISWNFAGFDNSSRDAADPTSPLIAQLIFDGGNSTISTAQFQVRSIVGKCIIKATANFVTGFLGCDELVIESRTTPLRIIASIVAGKLNIHPNALKSGIIWSSIYHPQATMELRAAKILAPLLNGTDCQTTSTNSPSPIWHPLPSIPDSVRNENCNVISLRAKADPFRWTAVDPDCGLVSGNSATTCKHRLINFFVFEHGREGDL